MVNQVNSNTSVYTGITVNDDKKDSNIYINISTQEIESYSLENLADSLKRLPHQKRYQSTFEILKNTKNIPTLIAKLEPIKGVREAVVDFLYEQISPEGNLPFSKQEVEQMFPSAKLLLFFPQYEMNKNNIGANDLIYGILAEKKGEVAFEVLEKKERCSGSIAMFGYRYPTSLTTLNDLLVKYQGDEAHDKVICRGYWYHNGPLTTREKQKLKADLAGLITLGYYNQEGYGIFGSDTGRGDGQVERDIPELHSNIEKLLKDSFIARMPTGLMKRLLVETWGGNKNDSGLIDSIRRGAVYLEDLPNFYPIRVEIHNLPTPTVLQKTKDYAKEHQQKLTQEDQYFMDALIADMEKFLGVSEHCEIQQECSWSELSYHRQQLRDAPETIKKYFSDKEYKNNSLRKGIFELQELRQIDNLEESFAKAITLTKNIIEQVVFDDMLPADMAGQYILELDSLSNDAEIDTKRKVEMTQTLLGNLIDIVHESLRKTFAKDDDILYLVTKNHSRPPKFIDALLRTNNIFLIGQLADYFSDISLSMKKIRHCIDGIDCSEAVEVYNPGTAEGVLRFNKNPMTMKTDEIGAFSKTPYETTPLAGIITTETLARLSHLQLLAKALKIPTIRVASSIFKKLEHLEEKHVQLSASKQGALTIIDASQAVHPLEVISREIVEVPQPDLSIRSPIPFSRISEQNQKIAGPKGIQLAKMFNSKELASAVPNGFIIPFGFFDKYIKVIGISQHLQDIANTAIDDSDKVIDLIGKVKKRILNNPLPQGMLDEVEKAIEELQEQMDPQTYSYLKINSNEEQISRFEQLLKLKDLCPEVKNIFQTRIEELQRPIIPQTGFFFRSDTNIEDLPNFNGAGLNKTVPHVTKNSKDIDLAIRRIWVSIFKQKSLHWRTKALSSDKFVLAVPSIVVMPTIEAKSSGVVVASPGAEKLSINANWGIGSVVEATKAVEEIVIESQIPHRLGFSASSLQPVPNPEGGLTLEEIASNKPVLSGEDIKKLTNMAKTIETVLGHQPNGWDIEWAFNNEHQLKVLQARSNMS